MITRLSSPAGTAACLGLDERVTMGRRDANRAGSRFVAAARGRRRAALPRGGGLAPSSLRAAKRHEETKEKAPATGAAKQEKKPAVARQKRRQGGKAPKKRQNRAAYKAGRRSTKSGQPPTPPPLACVPRRRGGVPRRAEHGHHGEEKHARAPEWAPRSGCTPCVFFRSVVQNRGRGRRRGRARPAAGMFPRCRNWRIKGSRAALVARLPSEPTFRAANGGSSGRRWAATACRGYGGRP